MKRRTFIKAAGLAAASSTLPLWFREELRAQNTVPGPKMANDRLGIALIGCGGRGTVVAREMVYYGGYGRRL